MASSFLRGQVCLCGTNTYLIRESSAFFCLISQKKGKNRVHQIRNSFPYYNQPSFMLQFKTEKPFSSLFQKKAAKRLLLLQ
ncbi:hypothetical protein DC20_06865 [Rufibacter tibetensis]|uniref:Uncharacterized protein n=1 Tax=Rufibacter tibetensis TaxID=512763 RepID=A0A0N7HWA9_9BACT|nr:hypothetical protein DC20_06865 [Rufibacter tibetensis]